ncbi:MAG: hypothetical protein HYY76_08625 [Acidobacteria bacterium]|nr:hypothetical protein [Acidobacteriota bacterium]
MNPNVLRKSPAAPGQGRPVQDEWGLYDPDQAGVPALIRTLQDKSDPPSGTDHAGRREWAGQCPYCSEPLPAGARQCPLCLREVASGSAPQPLATGMAAAQLPLKAKSGAVYTLESPVRCPECTEEIRTIRVLRVLRTQVSFTSTLPRKGYIVVCPACERLISAALSGLL